MKLATTGLLGACALALCLNAGCENKPKTRAEMTQPRMEVTSTRTSMVTGEALLVSAETRNLVGARNLRWTVQGPDNARGATITPEAEHANQTAIFTAKQPGNYRVVATAEAPDGRQVSQSTLITVVGRDPAQRTARQGQQDRQITIEQERERNVNTRQPDRTPQERARD